MVTTSKKPHVVVRMPRAQRREQIVRAAARAFLTTGFEKTSMEDVARAAGVTRLIVYRIFESKEALYIAVLSAVLDDLASSFDALHERRRSEPRGSIAPVLLGVARRQPDGFRLLWRHTSNQAEFTELYSLFKSAATDYAVGLLGSSLGDPLITRWAAESLVSTIYESICLWLDNGDPARDDEFLRLVGSAMRATVMSWEEQARRTSPGSA